MDTFPYKDRGLENEWRLCRTGVIWSRRRAPATNLAAALCAD